MRVSGYPGNCLFMKVVSMNEFIFFTIIVALIAAFSILLIAKWGLRERLQVHGGKFISGMAGCDFCISFWVGLFFSVLFAILLRDWSFLFIPICSTPLTRSLI